MAVSGGPYVPPRPRSTRGRWLTPSPRTKRPPDRSARVLDAEAGGHRVTGIDRRDAGRDHEVGGALKEALRARHRLAPVGLGEPERR